MQKQDQTSQHLDVSSGMQRNPSIVRRILNAIRGKREPEPSVTLTSMEFVEGQPIALAMVWECPKCGFQIGQPKHGIPGVADVTFSPGTCSWGHEPTEMEQRSADRWLRQFDA